MVRQLGLGANPGHTHTDAHGRTNVYANRDLGASDGDTRQYAAGSDADGDTDGRCYGNEDGYAHRGSNAYSLVDAYLAGGHTDANEHAAGERDVHKHTRTIGDGHQYAVANQHTNIGAHSDADLDTRVHANGDTDSRAGHTDANADAGTNMLYAGHNASADVDGGTNGDGGLADADAHTATNQHPGAADAAGTNGDAAANEHTRATDPAAGHKHPCPPRPRG